MARGWQHRRTRGEIRRIEEAKRNWRKITDEEKEHLKKLEESKQSSNYCKKYLEEIYKKKEGDNMGKPRAVTPEERERLLKLVLKEYHFYGDVMPTVRQLKKSHLFKLYELWNAFGSYDNLCKVVERELGVLVRAKKIVRKARDDKVKLAQPVIEQKKEVERMEEKELKESRITEQVQEVVKAEEEKEIIQQDNQLNKKKRNVKTQKCTKEEVIAELNKFYTETGKLPTAKTIGERRAAGEKWLAYETFLRHLGPKKGWTQYLSEAETVESDVPEIDTEEKKEDLKVVREIINEAMPMVEMFEAGDRVKMAELTNVSLKISLKMPGMSEPFELALDLSSE